MNDTRNSGLLGILARLGWMMIGPLILAVCTFLIIKTGNGWLTPADFGFLGALCGLIAARWFEFRVGIPLTAEGEPATPAHLRNYAIGVMVIGLLVWVIANVLGNHGFQA